MDKTNLYLQTPLNAPHQVGDRFKGPDEKEHNTKVIVAARWLFAFKSKDVGKSG